MKTVEFPENKEELRNILIHENISLRLTFAKWNYEIDGEDKEKFSADKLSLRDVTDFISDELRDLGIIVTWEIEH